MNITPICPYCKKFSVQVSGREIYPHRKDLYSKVFYRCKPCDAYVGCHPNSKIPLGRLANKDLRKAKSEAHKDFDFLWKESNVTRSEAYSYLAVHLGISREDCHIGMFDIETCNRVIEISDDTIIVDNKSLVYMKST